MSQEMSHGDLKKVPGSSSSTINQFLFSSCFSNPPCGPAWVGKVSLPNFGAAPQAKSNPFD